MDARSQGGTSTPSAAPVQSFRKTLHLGVLVQDYRSRSKKTSSINTGDVAEILEAKYGLFSVFAKVHEHDIVNAIEDGLQGALESLMMGRVVDPWGKGTSDIQAAFRDFISSYEAEHVGIPGTPTMAAKMGVNHRLKRPYRKSNPRRPSFRDTGLMMTSFRAWVD